MLKTYTAESISKIQSLQQFIEMCCKLSIRYKYLWFQLTIILYTVRTIISITWWCPCFECIVSPKHMPRINRQILFFWNSLDRFKHGLKARQVFATKWSSKLGSSFASSIHFHAQQQIPSLKEDSSSFLYISCLGQNIIFALQLYHLGLNSFQFLSDIRAAACFSGKFSFFQITAYKSTSST